MDTTGREQQRKLQRSCTPCWRRTLFSECVLVTWEHLQLWWVMWGRLCVGVRGEDEVVLGCRKEGTRR